MHFISQPTSLSTFSALHRIAGMEPIPFSPAPLSPCLSTGVTTYGTTSHPMPNVFSLVLLLLYATGILKDKAGDRDEHGKGWDAEGYDTWRRVRTV